MRIIKCDICNKEIADLKEYRTEYLNAREIDLCLNCSSKYNEFRDDLSRQEQQLNKEYNEKRKKIYDSTITKYGLNKE